MNILKLLSCRGRALDRVEAAAAEHGRQPDVHPIRQEADCEVVRPEPARGDERRPRRRQLVPIAKLGKLAKIFLIKNLEIFSGLVLGRIKRNFARKYAFDSIFQALEDLQTFAPLQSQNFRKKSV